MSASRVVLWRHGQTDWNLEGRIQGARDFPLNEAGRAQAREVAMTVAGLNPSVIVSSPLSRARDTAQAVADIVGLTVQYDHRFHERNYGAWEGKTREELLDEYPDAYDVWRNGGQPQGLGIEANSELGARFLEGVAEHAHDMDSGTLLIVAHGAAIRAGVTTLMGLDPETWSGLRGMDNCHWAIMTPQDNRHPAWRLVGYNICE